MSKDHIKIIAVNRKARYDYFIEDWEAYCRNLDRGDRHSMTSMTIDTALDFLKEMQ